MDVSAGRFWLRSHWLEQQGQFNRHWVRHAIDESYCDSLKLADIDGDGERSYWLEETLSWSFRHDPGSHDPLVIYYYKIDRRPAAFSLPHLSQRTAGAGTQFVTLDIDGTVTSMSPAGKTGYISRGSDHKKSREQREKELLLNTEWPFPGRFDREAGRWADKVAVTLPFNSANFTP